MFPSQDFLRLEQMKLDSASSFGLSEQKNPRLSHTSMQINEKC